jgi:putative ABC transport system ATP-binding protein
MLSIRSLAKSFGTTLIFQNVSLTLQPGEYVALMGESGVGKSTLLNIIAGLEPTTSGDIELAGQLLDASNDDRVTHFRREKLGFVFQAFHLLPYLTTFENIALPLRLNGWTASDIGERIAEMLDAVGLADRGSALPRELSGGQMQRVAIARALAHRPALLLADEPTGNLDPDSAAQILALLKREIARNNTAAILVTHSNIAAATAAHAVKLTRTGLVAHSLQKKLIKK